MGKTERGKRCYFILSLTELRASITLFCMPRQLRPIADGLLFHALNRGNNRAAVFFCPDDYLEFRDALNQTRKRYLALPRSRA